MSDEAERDSLITSYFYEGYTYSDICAILSQSHNILISSRQLIRILSRLGLKRKNFEEDDLQIICSIILEEIESSRSCLGYHTLWRKLREEYGLKVRRDTVALALQLADPEGVATRARRRLRRRRYVVPGPNFLWHIDGYDKLKPFGFSIHGCIDGYSRKIIWLEVATTNKDPRVIAHYYLNALTKYQFLPTMIRGDLGTENCFIETLQCALRFHHDDNLSGRKSYIKGKSTANQRIEAFWSQLRTHGINYWINFFKDMRDRGDYDDSDEFQTECLRYCFGQLIQRDLDTIRRGWNRHTIRRQKKNEELVHGKPNNLFYCAEKNYKKELDMDSLELCRTEEYEVIPKLFHPSMLQIVNILDLNSTEITRKNAYLLYLSILNKSLELTNDNN